MPRLPSISARDAVRVFEKGGYVVTGQKGSHVKLVNARGTKIIIPNHPGDLKRPLLKGLIKDAGFTEDEFRKLL